MDKTSARTKTEILFLLAISMSVLAGCSTLESTSTNPSREPSMAQSTEPIGKLSADRIKKGENLSVGDVVLKGEAVNTQNEVSVCKYPTFMIKLQPQHDRAIILGLQNTTDCELVVQRKESVPTTSVDPPTGKSGVPSSPELMAQQTSDTAEQWVDHYGAGGPLDELTEVYQKVWFDYSSGQYAQITDRDGWCWEFTFTGWTEDYCYGGYWETGQDSLVSSDWEGGFHHSSGQWYHSLINSIAVDEYGLHTCNYIWTGTIVSGVTNYCTS